METPEPEVVQHKLRMRLIERCDHLSEEVGQVIFAYNSRYGCIYIKCLCLLLRHVLRPFLSLGVNAP